MLNTVIENPSLIEIPTVQKMPLSLGITRLQNEINREIIDKPDCNDGSLQRISREIKDIFTNHLLITEFDTDLFTATVGKVLVYRDGNTSLTLNNKQTLGKENNYACNTNDADL